MLNSKNSEDSSVNMSNYGTIEKRPATTNRRPRLNFMCLNLLLFSILLMLVIFIIGCVFNFYIPHKYERVFQNIQISSRFNLNTYSPIVELKLKNSNIQLKANLIEANNLKKLNYWQHFDRLIENVFKTQFYRTKSKKHSFFELDVEKFEFNVYKLENRYKNSNGDDISCHNVSIVQKRNILDNTEVCLQLYGYDWFGGHESLDQPYWPINNQSFNYVPYVTGFTDAWGALYERYWLSSAGVSVFIDDDIPLFVRHTTPEEICFKNELSPPYQYTPVYDPTFLNITICESQNVVPLHLHMINNYLNFPKQRPDDLMMKDPVFTTWNYYFKHINQSVVINFAKEIKENGYNISQLEIDDKWELFYGDYDFDQNKFPNPSEMVNQLHEMNIRCTLWVHPFTNIDSVNFVNGTNNGYFVLDQSGQHPALTSWWDGKYAAILDTTNPDAFDYFTNKLNYLKQKYGIDSFKFDAGEASWMPSAFKLANGKARPDEYSQNYARLAFNQNNFVEVRTGHRNQEVPIFYRILDRATDWTIHDGIKSVITATLHFGLMGYPFVLPDIIAGNGDIDQSTKELYIRWTQLTAFLPAMQFGVPPWYFDQETNEISQTYVHLHQTFVYPYLKSLPLDGQPYIRPIFWLEPTNLDIYSISDQFLVGSHILVAPILDANTTSRQIYIPKGDWYDVNKDCLITGSKYINYKDISLDKIPYFIATNSSLFSQSKSYTKCTIHIY